MVLRVCRNALPDPNDAQDAFQATFLVLVRRHGSLRGLDSLGGWLYGVACRVAARARVDAARRRAVEARAAARVVEAVDPADADDLDRDEFGPIVHEEVRRLPERYRAAVVLCYWEGQTQEQAAAQLGCPLGTVRSRLARARDLLRRRLTRRGVEHLAIGMDSIRRLPPLAPELVQSTVQAAMRISGGQVTKQVVSGTVASLVQGMLWRTTMIKFGGIAAGAILVGLAGVGVGLAAQRGGDAEPAQRASVDSHKPTAAIDQSVAAKQTQPKSAASSPRAANRARPGEPRLIQSMIPGGAAIVRIVPDGSLVKKGDFICELGSPAVEAQLNEFRVGIATVEAEFTAAKLSREVAEFALREYVEGQYPSQLMEAEGDIHLAKAELDLAEEELKAANTGPAGDAATVRRKGLDLLRSRFALEKAQSRKNLLVRYTVEVKKKELEAAIQKARADEQAKRTKWEHEAQKEKSLDVCRIIAAPIDGRLRYHHQMGMSIELGAHVAYGQVMFTIEPQGW